MTIQPKVALIYAGFAFGVGALTQVLQAVIALSLSPFESWSRWGISVGAAAVAGGLAAALPWLKAVLPTPPQPTPVPAPVPPAPPAA